MISFLIAIFSSMVLTAVDVYSVIKSNAALANVFQNQMQPTLDLQSIDSALKEVRFRMAGVLLDQMPSAGSRNQIKEVREYIFDDWEDFKSSTANNQFSDEAKEQIAKIDKQMTLLPKFFDKLLAAYDQDQKTLIAPMLEDEWPVFQGQIIKPISLLLPNQKIAVQKTYDESSASGKKMVILGVSIFIASFLIMLAFGWRLFACINCGINALQSAFSQLAQGNLTFKTGYRSKDEFGLMSNSLEETALHLQQIVASVKLAADKASVQSVAMAKQVEQLIERDRQFGEKITTVAANMEEISVSNSEVAAMAENAASAVTLNEKLAQTGNANVAENMAVISSVVNTVNNSVNIVSQLNLSIQKIDQIATTIKEIADQTNLLALNAAIEAARAGEQGRGFAVVADEVRKLAERTSSSTLEISGVINSIRSETDSAVAAMSEIEVEVKKGAELSQQTGDVLSQIVSAASKATESVSSIVISTREQASATEDVAQHLEGISVVSEQNKAGIRDVGKMAEEVAGVATGLQGVIAQFK